MPHPAHPSRPHPTFSRCGFDAAIRPLRGSLELYAARRCGPVAAPDPVQAALSCAWSLVERFDPSQPPGRLLLWLRRFVDHACDEFIRQARAHEEEPLTPEVEAELEAVVDSGWRGELRVALAHELGRLVRAAPLSARQQVCIQQWLAGSTAREVAALLQISVPTVLQHIEAASRKLTSIHRCAHAEILECFYEEQNRAIYTAPESVGAALDREKLRRLAEQDARRYAWWRERGRRGL